MSSSNILTEASPGMRGVVAIHALTFAVVVMFLLYGRESDNALNVQSASSMTNIILHVLLVAAYAEVAYVAVEDYRQSEGWRADVYMTLAVVNGLLGLVLCTAFFKGYGSTVRYGISVATVASLVGYGYLTFSA